ncbi:MAG: hypothetical protein R6T98_06640 [Desulfatiglandales bacterium]
MLKRPAREPRPPARRAYAPEGTEKSPSSLDQEGLCKGFYSDRALGVKSVEEREKNGDF